MTTSKKKKPVVKVGITETQWQMCLSYLRSAVAAVIAVMATLDYEPMDLAKAFVAALIPPVLRWINPNDPAFGRGSN
jgi:predicted histidine transporter YuiF (NhaC family)